MAQAGKILGVDGADVKKLLGIAIASCGTFLGCDIAATVVASDNLKYSYDTEETAAYSWPTYTLMSTITIPVAINGTQRVKVDIKTNQDEPEGHIDVHLEKNGGGTISGSDVTGNGTYSTKSWDVTEDWSAGDVLQVWARAYQFGDTMYTRNLRIYWDVI